MKSLSKSELDNLISTDSIILDTRLNDEYIGWDLYDSKISGHIPGSLNFPYNWIEFASKDELKFFLSEKKINNEKTIILCDFNEIDHIPVLDFLKNEKIDNIYYFNLKLWNNKLEYYPEYRRLVPCIWLNDLINEKKVSYLPKNSYKIFEISWGKATEEFLNGHIPQSIHIDSEEFEKPPEWVRISDSKLIEFANKYGITKDITVILYGMDSLNQLGAAKLSVILEYMGVEDVRLLNGTFQNWRYSGFKTESGNDIFLGEKTDFGELIKKEETKIYDIEDIKKIFKNSSDTQIVDIRNYDCWSGKESGYCYVAKAGRIPGTVWCHHKTTYRNFDNTICSKEDIFKSFNEHNLDISKNIVTFCGSASWGAALIQVYSRVIGIKNLFIYEGGWLQWQLNPENEIIQGD